MTDRQWVAGLDVGTTKVCVVLGELVDGTLQLRSHGVAPMKGVKQGMVVNVPQASDAIRDAVRQAQQRCGVRVPRVLLSLSEMNTRPLPASRLAGGDNPRRMHNLVQSVECAGLVIADLVPAALASAEALVTEHDKQLGVAVVDIGGATTDIAVFARGELLRTSVLPVGGLHLTSDIAQGLETSLREAERIKRQHGCVFLGELDAKEALLIPSLGEQPPHTCTRAELVEIVEARVSELFLGVEHALKKADALGGLGAGLVLCGGSSQLPGLPELARQLLGLPVRCLRPVGVEGIAGRLDEAAHAVSVGLLLHAAARVVDTSPAREAAAG